MVNAWDTNVEKFRGDLADLKKIIGRFDEILLDKASKFAIKQLHQEIKNEFLTKRNHDEYVDEIKKKVSFPFINYKINHAFRMRKWKNQ